jgi:hypothetical protein
MESHQPPPQYVSAGRLYSPIPSIEDIKRAITALQFNSEFRIKLYTVYLTARHREWFEKHPRATEGRSAILKKETSYSIQHKGSADR